MKVIYGNKITEIETKTNISVANLYHRVLTIEEVIKIKESLNCLRISSNIEAVKSSDIVDIKQNIENANVMFLSLKDEIKTNLDLANAHYKDFVLFIKDFDDNFNPILDKMNQEFINGLWVRVVCMAYFRRS